LKEIQMTTRYFVETLYCTCPSSSDW